eukprot:evm.model.scf_1428.2 EVM.evm.TU.scf_1428.2   scf_1428:37599-37910(+)
MTWSNWVVSSMACDVTWKIVKGCTVILHEWLVDDQAHPPSGVHTARCTGVALVESALHNAQSILLSIEYQANVTSTERKQIARQQMPPLQWRHLGSFTRLWVV